MILCSWRLRKRSARMFVAIFSPPSMKSVKVFRHLNIRSRTMRSDHWSPKTSRARLSGHPERRIGMGCGIKFTCESQVSVIDCLQFTSDSTFRRLVMLKHFLSVVAYIVATFAVQATSHFLINAGHYASVTYMRKDPIFALGILS